MIGVISSTIFPVLDSHNEAPERLKQTAQTIASLRACGISKIYVADNSRDWSPEVESALEPAEVHRFEHFKDSRVKGPSEIHLLLGLLPHLPPDEPILKISGRYILKSGDILKCIEGADIAARFYGHFRQRTISTRCYLAKDRDTLQLFLSRTLNEIYEYSNRILGPRSLIRIVGQKLFDRGSRNKREGASIELAGARVLKMYGYKVHAIKRLNVEGYIMGRYFKDE